MSSLLTPPRKATRAPPQPAASLRVQSSLSGTPRSVGWGLARLAGNLIGTWDFLATSFSESTQGGKGGPGNAPVAGYSYTTAIAIGLSEGPIAGVRQMWTNKTPESLASLGFTLFEGGYGQGPWGWLVANEPAYAQNFRGLAYLAAPGFALGTSATLPNLTAEVRFAVSGAVTETVTIPATGPYTVTAEYFDITGNAAAEEITVPYAAPYQYDATNPQGLPFTQTLITDGTLGAGSSETGVYYTDTDPIAFLTQVATSLTPSTGQFTVTEAGTYTFAAGDAGENVTVVDLAVSPGVNYAVPVTGNLVEGSALVASLSTSTGVSVGAPVIGADVPAGAVVQQLSSGSATVNATSGSNIVMVTGGTYVAPAGTPVSDSAGVIPAGATVIDEAGAVATLSAAASGVPSGSVTETLDVAVTYSGAWGSGGVLYLASTAGIAIGAAVTDGGNWVPAGAVVTAVVANTSATVAHPRIPWQDWDPGNTEPVTFTATVTGTLSSGSTQVTGISTDAALVTGATVTDVGLYLSPGTTVSSSSGTSLTLSLAATGNHTGDVLTFPLQMTLSQAALGSGTGVALTVVGAALTQVLSSVTPAQAEFLVTPQGVYTFAAADAGKPIIITDVPDANPADVVRDFLTNPYYGLPLFPAARLGDLSGYAAYCKAAGLWVSPVLASQAAATQLLQDLMTATNSAVVWGNGGKLTVVPYGDMPLSANGASWSPQAAPYYSLDDDDFLPNQATNSSSVSAADSPDPVTVTRLDPADQVNDVQVEYLDRAQDYNPTIAEVQDDAGINLYGLKPSGSKQLHLLCDRSAAITAANLQLGREQVRNLYSFTIDRKYILLDPMDIIAITDAGLGLTEQWVRIREITENDDRSLSIVAEEYLAGTGSAPLYGTQQGKGSRPNYNIAPGDAL